MAPISAQNDEYSLLHIERISQYVSLSPASLNSPLPALCASIFSPLLLSYFPPAKGIVLAYEDVQLSSTPPGSKTNSSAPEPLLLRHVDEYTSPFLWATASLLVLRPEANKYLTGRITHQSKTHITCSHLNTFPVSVTKDHLPDTWTWQQAQSGKVSKGWDGRLNDEGGCWVDANGEKIEGELKIRIRDFDGRMDGRGKGKGFLKVEGSLLSQVEERERREKGQKGKERANGAVRSSREPIEVE
jgi:DNA-directed RNA polymerase I subunit RPA43